MRHGRKQRWVAFGWAAGVLLALGGCAHPTPVGDVPPDTGGVLLLDNTHFLDADVYAVTEYGVTQRLGTVTGNTTGRLVLPARLWNGASTVRLRILCRAIGSGARTCDETQALTQGDSMRVTTLP